jgi:hypothetical protein
VVSMRYAAMGEAMARTRRSTSQSVTVNLGMHREEGEALHSA